MKTWCLSHAQDGTSVSLEEVPFWAWALREAGDSACWALEQVTGTCLIDPPEWMWNLRWGPADEDGYTDHCLGAKVHQFGQSLLNGFGAYRREETVARLPVTSEWVREHCPKSGWPWDGSEIEEET